MARIEIPQRALVLLIGTSGSGKTAFAARHFSPTDVLSSDVFRGRLGEDEADQAVTARAFDALHAAAWARLQLGHPVVIDATNLQPYARRPLARVARDHGVAIVAIVLDVPEAVCLARNRERTDRYVSSLVVRRQRSALRRSLALLDREGYQQVVVLHGVEEIEAAEIVRSQTQTDDRPVAGREGGGA